MSTTNGYTIVRAGSCKWQKSEQKRSAMCDFKRAVSFLPRLSILVMVAILSQVAH
jgi:hypothetical protein